MKHILILLLKWTVYKSLLVQMHSELKNIKNKILNKSRAGAAPSWSQIQGAMHLGA